MEISIEELQALTAGVKPAGSTGAEHLVGGWVLVRTRISGVSVGRLRSVTVTDAGWVVVLDEGRRIWSWSGGALACSELAAGCAEDVRTEAHPDGIVIADEGLELIPTDAGHWS